MTAHKSMVEGQRHPPHNWSYADAPARRAATGFVAAELYDEAIQADDLSKWRLIQVSPALWEPIQESTMQHAVMGDEFFGADIDAKWRKTIVGGSSHAVINNVTPSVLRLRAGANIGDVAEIDWGDNHSLDPDSNAEFRSRIFPQEITDVICEVGLTRDAGAVDCVLFRFSDAADSNWQAICRKASSETKVDTGVAFTSVVFEMLIECKTGEVRFWINGAIVATIATNVPVNTQQMHLRNENEAAAENKDLWVDFVRADEKR